MEFRAVAMSELVPDILPYLGCINHWQVNPAGPKKETNYRFFSLLSLLMAILLLKGRMPQADVHQKPRQTTNGCRKPSTETDLLSQGELKHSSLIELPSCITRGWVQTPLLLPWGHPSSPPASTDQPNIESQVAGPSY